MAMDWAGSLSNLGQVFGGAAAGSAAQRNTEAQTALSADQLQRRSALLSSLLGGVQDAQVTSGNPNIQARTPQVTGGLRPSAMLGGGRRDALMSALGAPVDVQKAGAGEKTLGAIGIGASIAGAAQPLLGPLLGLLPGGGPKEDNRPAAQAGGSGTFMPQQAPNMFETPDFQAYLQDLDERRPPATAVDVGMAFGWVQLEDGTWFDPNSGDIYDANGQWVGNAGG